MWAKRKVRTGSLSRETFLAIPSYTVERGGLQSRRGSHPTPPRSTRNPRQTASPWPTRQKRKQRTPNKNETVSGRGDTGDGGSSFSQRVKNHQSPQPREKDPLGAATRPALYLPHLARSDNVHLGANLHSIQHAHTHTPNESHTACCGTT